MRRILFFVPVLLVAVAVACGGDSEKEADASLTLTGGASGVGAGTPTPDVAAIPKPSPITIGKAFDVTAVGQEYAPTVDELKTLPQTEITVNGKKYSGVSLAYLGTKVKSVPSSQVTVEGYRADWKRVAFFRLPVSEIGAETVVFVDAEGYLSIASTKVPESEWLKSIISVAFP